MSRGVLAIILFILVLLCLAWNARQSGLASGYIDPVGRIAPQDEAVYSHIALRMAHRGDWLTPHFLGRFALFKPPLLYWSSAASVTLLGDTLLALRLPSLLAGALIPALLAFWIGGGRGVTAALLLALHPLWFTLARLNLTDALLALWITLAAVSLWKESRLGFAAATAAAILTKGIAGLTPLFIWAAWALLTRTAPWRWLAAIAGSFVLAAPWFLYQLAVHPHWFWAEFVNVEILGYSLGAPPQTTGESPVTFYAKRLFLESPVLCILLVSCLPALWRARRDRRVLLLISWMVVCLALPLANAYRNIAYVLPALPAMAWAAGEFFPGPRGRRDWVAAIVVATVLLAIGVGGQGKPWGIPFAAADSVSAAAPLQRYAAMHRPNDLVLVEVDDEFVATTLPLPRVRYAFRQPEENYRRYGLDFRELGIALSVEEFLARRELLPRFAQRLRDWSLNSTEPVGTVILLQSADDLRRLLHGSPEVDFLIPARLLPSSEGVSHKIRDASHDLVLLLSRR